MAPKKNVTEEAFHAFKCEVERNSRHLVEQLLQKINKLEEKYEAIEQELNDMKIKYDRVSKQQIHNEHNQKTETGHNTDISRPTFFGSNRDVHPKDFLYRLEEYFAVKQSYVGEKIIIAGDCLKAAALSWFSTIRFQLSNYDDFKKAFIDEFWSREIQIQVWSQCLSTKQVPANTNYREHFATWATKLRHLEVPRLSEQEIVKHIARHYPGYLRAILISLPECTILAAMKILGEEGQSDQSPESNSNQQKNNNKHNSDQNNQNNNNNWSHRVPQNDWGHRTQQQRNNNQPRNNRWNNRDEQQSQQPQRSRDTNQQINQVTAVEVSNENNDTSHSINKIQNTEESFSPYIQCMIEGEEIELLVDTGATISVLTKEVVDIIINKDPTIPQLPINGVRISNAVGKQICKISKQVFCKCRFNEAIIHANFIQVEGLNEKGIIGADILNQHDAQINFSNHTIQFKINNILYSVPFSKKLPKPISLNDNIREIALTDHDEQTTKISNRKLKREKYRATRIEIRRQRHINTRPTSSTTTSNQK